MYAVVHQESEIDRGLVAGKTRLAKKGLTIPRLELNCIDAHGSQSCRQCQKHIRGICSGGVCMDGQIVRLLFTGLPIRVTTNSL